MSDETSRAPKIIKGMDEAEWQRARDHTTARGESMASFAARAFRQMREADLAGPQYQPPAPGIPAPVSPREYPAAQAPAALTIGTVAELAALMHGVAAMANAAGVRVPESHARQAIHLARAAFGEVRQAQPRRPQPEALRLANERRQAAAKARKA